MRRSLFVWCGGCVGMGTGGSFVNIFHRNYTKREGGGEGDALSFGSFGT